MIKCLIIEDEENSRELLKKLIIRYCPELEIVGLAGEVNEAVTMIRELKPTLIFLDIEINGGSGFDVLNKLEMRKLGVIFTTGYNDFAIKAIKYSAIDYLLKPIHFEDLIDAVQRFKSQVSELHDDRLMSVKLNDKHDLEFNHFIIPSMKGFTVHNLSDVVWLQSDGNYTKIKIKNEVLMASRAIGYFQELLPPAQFCRIHNRSIVNAAFVKEFVRGKTSTIVLTNGEEFEVSERRKEGLMKFFKK